MVTNTDINDYLYCIRARLAEYGSELAKRQKLGYSELGCMKLKFSLASRLIKIMVDYFDNVSLKDYQFFTVTQINDIMQHINNILGSNCWVDLEDDSAPYGEYVRIYGIPSTCSPIYADYSLAVFREVDEGDSDIQWYRMTTVTGENLTPIVGANSREYYPSNADLDSYVFYVLTPKDESGTVLSDPIPSEYVYIDSSLALPAPAPTYPLSISDVPLSPTFTWDPVAAADNYRIQVSDTYNDFTSPVIDEVVNTTSYTPSTPLDQYKTYYWHVQSMCAGNASQWSAFYEFTTVLVSLNAPQNLLPSSGTIVDAFGFSGSWDAVQHAAQYNVQLSDDNTFSNILIDTTVANPSFSTGTSTLKRGNIYYWRVKAINGSVESVWSNVSNITLKLEPPTLTAPADGSSMPATNAVLEWDIPINNVMDYTEWQVATDPSFVGLVYEDSVAAPTDTVTLIPTIATGTYFWRARIKNTSNGLYSDYSDVWSFDIT